jgi:hypothetical protein
MQVDNVSSPEMPGFGQLGISPHSVEEILRQMLSRCYRVADQRAAAHDPDVVAFKALGAGRSRIGAAIAKGLSAAGAAVVVANPVRPANLSRPSAGKLPRGGRIVGTIVIPHRRISAPLALHLSAASAGNCGLHDLPGYPTCQQQKSEKYEETSHHAYRAAVLPVPHATLAVPTAGGLQPACHCTAGSLTRSLTDRVEIAGQQLFSKCHVPALETT